MVDWYCNFDAQGIDFNVIFLIEMVIIDIMHSHVYRTNIGDGVGNFF